MSQGGIYIPGQGHLPSVGTPDDLLKKVLSYFRSCHKDELETEPMLRPYTLSGLALALKVNRNTLIMYSRDEKRKDFQTIMAYARARIEAFAEEQLYTNKNTSGIALSLKNNFGWRDQVTIKPERPENEIKLVNENMTDEQSFQLYMDVINTTHANKALEDESGDD